MRVNSTLFIILTASNLLACRETTTPSHTGQVKEELRSREVVHLTQTQITERANALGDSLIVLTENRMASALGSNTDSSCMAVFEEVAQSIKKDYNATVRRIPFDERRLAGIGSKKEREILDAYFYSRSLHQPLAPNLQADGPKDFIFTKALVVRQQKCVSCHSSESMRALHAAPGDTLGIWDVSFTRKQVVLSFVD